MEYAEFFIKWKQIILDSGMIEDENMLESDIDNIVNCFFESDFRGMHNYYGHVIEDNAYHLYELAQKDL